MEEWMRSGGVAEHQRQERSERKMGRGRTSLYDWTGFSTPLTVRYAPPGPSTFQSHQTSALPHPGVFSSQLKLLFLNKPPCNVLAAAQDAHY